MLYLQTIDGEIEKLWLKTDFYSQFFHNSVLKKSPGKFFESPGNLLDISLILVSQNPWPPCNSLATYTLMSSMACISSMGCKLLFKLLVASARRFSAKCDVVVRGCTCLLAAWPLLAGRPLSAKGLLNVTEKLKKHGNYGLAPKSALMKSCLF